MKHQIFFTVVIVILLYNSSSLALDQMGPPVATLSKGDLHLGIDYSYSDLDFDVSGPVSGAPLYDKALGDAEIHKAFFHFGYGVTDNLELILRVGGAQMEVNGDEEDIVGFNFFDDDSGLNFAFGVGIKLTFYETEKLKCGALYSFSYIDFDDFPELNVVVQGTPLSFTPEIRLTENQIALGIDYHLMENLSLYGGPLLHFSRGDADLKIETWDIEEDSPYGGFVGITFSILSSDFNIKYAGTGGGWGMGARWLYNF